MSFNKIFCIGLSRTGTTSLCEAISMLDIPTIHYPIQLFVQPEMISGELSFEPSISRGMYKKWMFKKELNALKEKDFASVLDKNICFGDLPIPLLYKQLDQKYPRSKFIYTYRNEEKWLHSMKWLFNKGPILWNQGGIDDEIRYVTYGSEKYDKKSLLNAYKSHHDDVLEYFKNRTDDFLQINIDQSRITFADICPFLGLEVPKFEFPKSNKAKEPTTDQYIHYYLNRSVPLYGLILNKIKSL